MVKLNHKEFGVNTKYTKIMREMTQQIYLGLRST